MCGASVEEGVRCIPVGCDGVVCDPVRIGKRGEFVTGTHYKTVYTVYTQDSVIHAFSFMLNNSNVNRVLSSSSNTHIVTPKPSNMDTSTIQSSFLSQTSCFVLFNPLDMLQVIETLPFCPKVVWDYSCRPDNRQQVEGVSFKRGGGIHVLVLLEQLYTTEAWCEGKE